jgi:hypothetical protein
MSRYAPLRTNAPVVCRSGVHRAPASAVTASIDIPERARAGQFGLWPGPRRPCLVELSAGGRCGCGSGLNKRPSARNTCRYIYSGQATARSQETSLPLSRDSGRQPPAVCPAERDHKQRRGWWSAACTNLCIFFSGVRHQRPMPYEEVDHVQPNGWSIGYQRVGVAKQYYL